MEANIKSEIEKKPSGNSNVVNLCEYREKKAKSQEKEREELILKAILERAKKLDW